MQPRIQIRLALLLGGLVLLIEAGVLFALGNFYFRRFGAEVDRRLEETLRKPGELVAHGALSTDAFGQRDTLEAVVGPALNDAMVVSADGTILVALDNARVGRTWGESPELQTAWLVRARHGGFSEKLTEGSNSFLIRLAPVAATGGEAPVLFNYLRISTTESERELAHLRVRLIGGSVAAVVATSTALLLGVHFLVTRRLRRITQAVANVTEGNYETRLGPGLVSDEIGFLAVGLDSMSGRQRAAMADLRQAVSELAVAEQKYRVLVENAAEAILVAQEGRLAFVNSRCGQMLAGSPETLLGRTFADFIHADDRPKVLRRLTAAVAAADEIRVVAAGRKELWVELNTVMIEWKGAPALLFFIRDVTQRKQAVLEREKLQAQLSQAQKMESIGRLAGGVAHDFNNMLQAILGNVGFVREAVAAGGPVQEGLDEIEKSAKRSADLTRQLLAFARKQTVVPEVLELNGVIVDMLKMLQRLIGENIQLVWQPGVKLWRVKMDPSQLDQILANLCVNARDAIVDSGRIVIETRNLTLDDTYVALHPESLPGDYVVLTVSDSGTGMDAETRARIFEPFFTTKEKGMGTGLGLATVFGIVQQNRGLINVYSEPGQGTTFKIFFPRCADAGEREEALPAAAVPAPVGGDETLLLVEDEEQVLQLSLKILTRRGYHVLSASTPQAALELVALHSAPIHLLITDVVMPGMNGKELRDRLREKNPRLRCVFMSGYTADIIAHHGVLEEGVEFVQKPFTIPDLLAKVRSALDAAGEG